MSNRRLVAAAALALVLVVGWYRISDRGPERGGSGAPLAAVAVPDALDPQARAGRALFEANCAECHGPTAAGRDGYGPPLVHPIYEPGHHADAAFDLAVANGVRAHHWRFGDMPPVAGLAPREVGRITAYVRALQRHNGIE